MHVECRQRAIEFRQLGDELMMVVVIPQHVVELAAGASRKQSAEPRDGFLDGVAVASGPRPAEIEDIAAEDEVFGF